MLIAKDIKKSFISGEERLEVLKGVNAKFEDGKTYSIVGASGSGKSTLLYILSLLEKKDEGDLILDGVSLPDISKKNEKKISDIRLKNFNFIFQFFNLMPTLTVMENLKLPFLIQNKKDYDTKKIDDLLRLTGLYDKKDKEVFKLSGGQKQRVSIIRAIIDNGSIIFADEPTGNLDKENTQIVTNLLKDLSKDFNKTVIIVTHDSDVANVCDYKLILENGILR